MSKQNKIKELEKNGVFIESEKEFAQSNHLEIKYYKTDNKDEKEMKIKFYDLISFCDYEIVNDKNKTLNLKNNNYTMTVDMDLPYSKYKVAKITTDENGKKVATEIPSTYKDKKLTFNDTELGEYAFYGRSKKLMYLPLIATVVVALASFGVTYSTIPAFRDKVNETFTDIFNLDKPTAPQIKADTNDWTLSSLVSVTKDSKVGGVGKLQKYEYCIREDQDYKKCSWVSTFTKNTIVANDGVHYVWFRGVSDRGTIGDISNMEKVMIDTSAPIIENFEYKKVTEDSIEIELIAKDELSGIDKIIYQINDGEFVQTNEYSHKFTNLKPNTEYTISVYVIDKVGNKNQISSLIRTQNISDEEDESEKEFVDKTLTMPTYEVDPANNKWSTYKYVTIHYPKNATTKEYSVDGGETWHKYEGPVLFTKTGTIIARCSNDENAIQAEPFDVLFIDPTIPIISLSNVPSIFEYMEDYKLPGYAKFGPSGGTVSCTVDGIKQVNTSTLKIGKHTIECVAISGAGAKSVVTKEIEVTYISGEDSIIGAWANLTLNYPDGSTNRKWMVYDQNTVVEYDSYYYQWSEYIGPIKIRVEDIEKVIIQYDLDGKTITSSYSSNPFVIIQPNKYEVERGKTAKVKLVYGPNEYKSLQYKINEDGAWTEYTGEFEVGPNTLIEAKIVTTYDVYEDGQKIAEKNLTSHHSTYINEKINYKDSIPTDRYEESLGIRINCPEYLDADEIGECTISFGSDFDATSYMIDSPSSNNSKSYISYNKGDKFKVLAGDYISAKGEYLDADNNIKTRTATFRVKDGTNNKIQIIPENPEPLENESTIVTIKYDELLTDRKYRVNGGAWINYNNGFEVESGSLVEAIATVPGQQNKSYASKQIGESIYNLNIKVENPNPKLGQAATVSINYNKYMTTKKYRVNGGSWIDYTGSFTVGPDSVIEAWGKVNNYYDVFEIAYTGHTDYDPSYKLKGPNIIFNDVAESKYKTEFTITTDKPARWIKYRYGLSGNTYKTYEYPLTISKGTWVCAIYQDEETGTVSEERCNVVQPPYEYNYGVSPYISYSLSPSKQSMTGSKKTDKVTVTLHPGGATLLQYSYDNMVWQDYTGPFDVYENCTIYILGRNQWGTDRDVIHIDYIGDVAPSPMGKVDKIQIKASPSSKLPVKVEEEILNADGEVEKVEKTEYVTPEKTTISIIYDPQATKKYYRIGTGDSWKEYTEPFDVTENCTIYAYQITPDGTSDGYLLIDFLEDGYAEPIIDYDPKNIATTLVIVDIKYDQNAIRNTYSTDGSTFRDYTGPFDVTEKDTVIYAKSEFEDGTIKYASAIVGTNISGPRGRIDSNSDAYYIIYLNYPANSYEPSRKYKYRTTGTLTNYKSEGIMLIKKEKVSDVLDADGNAYMIDEFGNKTLYTGDHYLLDVDISQIWEHVFMTWENGVVEAPQIIVDEEKEWTESVNVIISYPKEAVSKEYKIIYGDGKNTGWQQYTDPINISVNNTTIYARAINKAGAMSDEAKYVINNVDNGNPSVRYMRVKSTTISTITLEFSAVDLVENTSNTASGLNRYEYSLDGQNWDISNSPTYTFKNLATNTSYTLYARAFDDANNSTGVYSITAKTKNIDKPLFTVSPNATEWSTKKTVTIKYMAGNYVNEYSLDNGTTWQEYTGPITITSPSVIMARSSDGKNISYADTLNITRIDTSKPTTTIVSTPALSSRITVKVNAVDNESGISKYYYSLDGINYYTSFSSEYVFNNLTKDTNYKIYAYSENMSGLKSDIVTTEQKTLEIDPPFFTKIDSYNDKNELMNTNSDSTTDVIDNVWSYYKKITITYPYLDEDCLYQYAIIDLNNPGTPEWKNAVVDQNTHESTVDIVVNAENMAVIARVVSGPNVVSANTLKLNMIDRTEPTIDISAIPKSIQIGDSYVLPTNYAGDDNKSGATAQCTVKGNVVTNTNELRSGMQPLICTVTTGAGHSVTLTHTLPIYPSLTFDVDSILQGIKTANITTEGDFYLNVNTGKETVKYNEELWLYKGNTIFDDPDAKFCDDVEDKMCVIKVEGDLTIASGVTVQPQVPKKGFLIYVTGKLTNNGTITMTNKGYTGAGENVYLYKNATDVYEVVPANGGSGADATKATNSAKVNGNNGVQTSKRATGGGGAGGAVVSGNYTATSGAGAAGTSYSGGAGGGAAVGTCNVTANPGVSNGGAGGLGAKCGTMNYGIGGGVGNPTAKSATTANTNLTSESGTGGLLIIYANDFENNSTISSNGTDALQISGTNASGSLYASGGGSGAGSVNIFYDNLSNKGTVTANGGKGGAATNAVSTANGGNGADGRVTYNTIVDGQVLGSKTNPYQITNEQEFLNIKNIIKDYDSAYFEITTDLDFKNYTFESIGTPHDPFSANVDGKNHVLRNITIEENSNDNVGVFGLVSNATIKNLTIANAEVTGNNNVGILAGSVYDDTTIDNVKVTGTVTGNENVGGLVGFASSTSNNQVITNAIAEVTISADANNAGGLVGKLYTTNNAKTTVDNTGATANITSTSSYVGGLVGTLENNSTNNVEITSSYATGQLTGTDYVGGLIGKATAANDNTLFIDKVVSGADAEGNNYISGFIPYISKANITNSYETGSITSNDYAGAFTAYVENSTIANTYAIGEISSTTLAHVGGYAAISKNTQAENSYFSSQTTKVVKTALGINSRIKYMLSKNTSYNSFDFDNIWSIDEGATTAYLQGLYIPTNIYNINYNDLQGAGSINNPYLIYNATDLIEINNELDAHYKMMADVDLTGIKFDPIGQEDFVFTGTLDGNNHKITGLNINKNNLEIKDNIGLFETLKGATITDLTIEGANITGDNNVGILAGKIDKTSVISNVSVSGNIESNNTTNKILNVIPANISNKQTGARDLADKTNTEYNDWLNYLNGTTKVQPIDIITASQASKITTSTGIEIYSGRVGGLVGYIDLQESNYSTTINNVTTDVTISTDGNRVGGVIGNIYEKLATNNSFVAQNLEANVTINDENSKSSYVGGAVGYIESNSTPSITLNTVTTTGEINGVNYVAGIVGKIENKSTSTINIEDVITSTEVNATGNYAAGVVGWIYNTTTGTVNVDGANNSGNITSTKDFVGGIIGTSQNITTGTINITNIASTGNIAGVNQVGGAIGYIYSQNKGTTNVSMGYATGVVNATGTEVGGFIGRSTSTSTTVVNNIDKCYATGAVGGTTRVGGFVGFATYSKINDTFATGAVNATNNVGSYVGEVSQTTINNSYAIGRIYTTGTTVGGFAATATNTTATNDYFSSQTTGYIKTAVGVNIDTKNNKIYKLLRQATYANYNFDTVWSIVEDETTAYLQGLPQPNSVIESNIAYNHMAGEGTQANPYQIATPDDLNDVRNEASAYYIVVNDIDMDGYTTDGINPMRPIGESVAPFSGTIDGQGYTIKNYTYSSNEDNVGLFSLVSNATIKNLNIDNFDITGKNYVGTLVGNVLQGVTIDTVNITDSKVTGTGNYVGGIIGYINESVAFDSNINKVTTDIDVTGVERVGGLIGYSNQSIANANIKISESSTDGTVTGNKYVGGLIGYNLNSKASTLTLENNINNATITGSSAATESMGGLVGHIENQATGVTTITGNTNNGDVTNLHSNTNTITVRTGGIVGSLNNTSNGEIIITSNENNGDITGKDNVAGMIGYTYTLSDKMTIDEFINTGDISGRNNNGGMLGYFESNRVNSEINISNITNSGNVSGTDNIGGIIGQTLNRSTAKITFDTLVSENNNITGNNSVGGLLGLAYNVSTGKLDIKNSYATTTINTTSNYAGGLVGQIYGSNTGVAQTIAIDKSYATGNITTNGSYAGGLVGSIRATSKQAATITKSYATGNIKAVSYSGGLVGQALYTDITDTFATGSYENSTNTNATPTQADYIGGLVGSAQNSDITTSYAMGYILANGNVINGNNPLVDYNSYNTKLNVGSLIGYSDSTVVTDSYYSSEVSGIFRGVNGISRAIKEITHAQSYAFDYDDVWTIDEGTSIPYLQGLQKPTSVEGTNYVQKHHLNGNGTEEDPYLIYNVTDLSYIRYDRYAAYKLMNNIDLTIDSNGTKFLAIGELKEPFRGILDGNGYKIYNGEIATMDDSVGLFGSLQDATIRNLTLENITYPDVTYVGQLAGMAYENVTVRDVNVVNNNVVTGVYVGGIFGYISQIDEGTTNIENINIKALLKAHESSKETVGGEVGGLIGHVYDNGVNDINISNITIDENSVININEKPIYTPTYAQPIDRNIGGIIGKLVSGADNNINISIVNMNADINSSLSSTVSTHLHTYNHNIGGLIGYNTSDSSMNLNISNANISGDIKLNEITRSKAFTASANIGGAIGLTEEKAQTATNKANIKLDSVIVTTEFAIDPEINATTTAINFAHNVGGLIGKVNMPKVTNNTLENQNNLTITGCSVTSDITQGTKDTTTGKNYSGTVGGLVGYIDSYSTMKTIIEKSFTTGDIKGNDYVGGIVGRNDQNAVGTNVIELVYTTGNIKGNNYVGGLVGESNGVVFNTLQINKAYFVGNIEGNDYVGGIAGMINYMELNNLYSTGKAKGHNYTASFVGKLSNTTVNHSYAVGEVTSTNTIGGFVTEAQDSIANNSYFSSDSTKLFRTALGTNLRIDKMVKVDPCYEEWDFDTIWAIETGNSLAYLKELPRPDSVNASNYSIKPYKGQGTSTNAYEIYTAEDLSNMRIEANANYKLMNDIDLTGLEVVPIGEDNQPFTGTFDGQGFTISHMNIDDTGFYNGLFGVVEDATIKNVKLTDVTVNSTKNDTGALIGLDRGNTRIENIEITYSSIIGAGNTGGLIGSLDDNNINETVIKNIKISPVDNDSIIRGSGNVGGLIGYLNNETLEEVYITDINLNNINVEGSIKKFLNIGGLIGYAKNTSDATRLIISDRINLSGNIKTLDSTLTETNTYINSGGLIGNLENSYGYTNISNLTSPMNVNHTLEVTNASGTKTTYNRTGGLVGYANLTGSGDIIIDGITSSGDITTNQTSTGTVTRNTYTGGLIGMTEINGTGNVKVSNSSTSRDVSGIGYVGGAFGYIYNKSTGTIEVNKVYATGNVEATGDYAGGFVAFMNSPKNVDDIIKNSYASGNIKSEGDYAGGFAGQTIYANINDCYAVGDVEAKDYVSAFIASSDFSVVENVYAIGKITSDGKFIGSILATTNNDTFTNAYFSSEATGYAATKAGLNVRYQKLLEELTYNGFNFSDTWSIDQGTSTAYLQGLPIHTTKQVTYAQLQGNGTVDNPYLIHNEIELKAIAGDLGSFYELANDITIPDGFKITPFGTEDTPFTGTFNGAGHTISNLVINYSMKDAGLFGYMKDATIKNVNINNAEITSTYDYAGIVAGRSMGFTTIQNVEATGSVTATGKYVGGLIGAIQTADVSSMNISNINLTLEKLSGNSYVGGLAGYAANILNGTASISHVTVESQNTKATTDYAGNLIGQLNATGVGSTTFEDIYVYGEVTAANYAGGMIGQSNGNLSNPIVVQRVEADNVVQATTSFGGGLLGDAKYTNLIDVGVTGKIGCLNYSGGIAGRMANSSIQTAYAFVNEMDFNNNYGPLIGAASTNVYDSVYYSKAISYTTSSFGTNLAFEDITKKASYQGFTFGTLWKIKENQTMPYINRYKEVTDDMDTTIYVDSILDGISKVNHSSVYDFVVEDITYPVHIYVYDEDQVWSGTKTFGTDADVSVSGEYAKRMVVVKVNGDLTVNSGAKVQPYYTAYGGPKGFTLYVTGTLTNNGTIDNSHGAKATGQDVYLWKNPNGDYEVVNATGGSGSPANTTGGYGTGRTTGGGAGGGDAYGGTGTSYSGGTGGGCYGSSGANDGGQAGYGRTYNTIRECAGGAGNPNGGYRSQNGTGGLLILYANDYINNGSITALGASGGNGNQGAKSHGGSSGGGSINIFTNKPTNINATGTVVNQKYIQMLGNVSAQGGLAYYYGGNGTVNIGEIRDGQYYDLKEIIKQDQKAYKDANTISGDSILSIIEQNNLETGYYDFKVETPEETKIYPVHLYNYDEDQHWTSKMTFGDGNDVSKNYSYTISGVTTTERSEAQNMVIVKVNGDLTIDSGVLVEPYYTAYGGPKGFTLYVTGKLTNNGTIDNSHGAYATGENVYLTKNSDETYEFIRDVGKSGSGAKTAGSSGSGRETGGGAGGGDASGGQATSYSGGTGGGCYGSSGSNIGGQGGSGNTYQSIRTCGGGAGNPNGGWESANGTGGLLVIYANEYENKGLISANGANGGLGNQGQYGLYGGSSGGGSINIFTGESMLIDKLGLVSSEKYNSVKGSTSVSGGTTGRVGGAGTVNIGQIRDGQYYDLSYLIENDKRVFTDLVTVEGDGIISIIDEKITKTGYYNLRVNGQNYPAHVYVYDEDQTWSGDKPFGDANDIATSSLYAKNMVIVKVNGNLTVNSGALVRPYYSEYGGPKGFALYVTGTLTNNGTIDNSHGAKAEGQDVYLWKNPNGKYEYVPQSGAGNSSAGSTISPRATGGGGQGAGGSGAGVGAAGTSYSGGAGGAAIYSSNKGGPGGANGGAGGNTTSTYYTGSGAGNPAGTVKESVRGSNGTGGLLILYANNYINNGTISAHGANGGLASIVGGGSGGGSVNIFINQKIEFSELNASTNTLYSKILGSYDVNGGIQSGGTGTLNIGQIIDGQYYDLQTAIQLVQKEFIKVQTTSDSPKYSLVGYQPGVRTITLSSRLSDIKEIYYSIDDGENWILYEQPFDINGNVSLKVKAKDNSNNEITELTYPLNDFVDEKAFDKDTKTYYTIAKETTRRIDLDEELIDTTLRIYSSGDIAANASIKLYDNDGNVLKSSKVNSSMTSIKIVENAAYVEISAGSSALNITEINVRDMSLSIAKTNVPKTTINQVGYYNNKIIAVEYPSGDNYVKEYSLDEGETWLEYTGPITVNSNTSVITRVTKDGEYITSSVYNVTKYDNIEPSIDLDDLPSKVELGESHNVPSNYSLNGSLAQANIVCKANGNELTNTRSLSVGQYDIVCTITTGAGNSSSVAKHIKVIESLYTMTGTVKQEIDGEETLVTEGNLVFFSDHQDVVISSEGTFEVQNLENATHEIYYMGMQDASSMTKEQVEENAICSATFELTDQVIELTCKNDAVYKIVNITVGKQIDPDEVNYIAGAIEVSYSNEEHTNCKNLQCALDELNEKYSN